jgi:hypothetical protein
MRTLYTLFALISLVLVSLVATAAGRDPTLNPTCDNCGGIPTFAATGLNPHKLYGVVGDDGIGDTFLDVFDSTNIDKQGNYSQPSSDGFATGSWNFTLWELRNNLPYKALDGPYTVSVD